MKIALLVSSVVFCTIGAMAQAQIQQQSIPHANNPLPVHAGDAFTVRLTDVPQTPPSSLLKNGIRTVGLAATAYQTEKLVAGNSSKPGGDRFNTAPWLAPVGVATTLGAGKIAGLFNKSPRTSVRYALYDNHNNLLDQKVVQVT